MPDFAALYRGARERISTLARDASDDELARTVPGCPEWTVADTVAHLVGVADDALGGRLASFPSPDETAAQVARHRGRSLAEVLADWEELGPKVEAAVAAREMSSAVAHDAVTHEADIRGALGAGRPPEEAWSASFQQLARWLPKRVDAPGSLTVDAGDVRLTAGEGEPTTAVTVEPYELWRALLGRRSRAQLAGWDWDGDPARYLAAFPAFGPTEQDLHD